MNVLSKINTRLEKIYAPILAGAFFGITIVLTINVIMRYIFNNSFFWAEEVTNYLIVWITFVGSALCVRYGMHVSVDMILQYAPAKTHRWIIGFTTVIAIAFVGLLTVVGVQQCLDVLRSGQVSATLRMPMYIPYAAIPVGAFLMLLEWVEQLWKVLSPGPSHPGSTSESSEMEGTVS